MLLAWGFLITALHFVAGDKIPHVEPEVLSALREWGQDEAFAKLLGINDVNLVRPQEGRSEDDMFTTVSSLGDIMLTPEQEEQARQGINFGRYPSYKWPNNEIPYAIQGSDFSSSQRYRIESSIRTLSNSLTNLKIRKRTSNDKDYVMIFSGNGCYSNLGKTGGQQALSLQSNGCLRVGTIQHEFIHAAGFTHEHNHPLRDDYVKILWENIPSDWRSQYEKANPRDFGVQGPYDYYSVMHYPINAPGTDKPAFEFYNENVDTRRVGQRIAPSRTDIDKINNLYS